MVLPTVRFPDSAAYARCAPAAGAVMPIARRRARRILAAVPALAALVACPIFSSYLASRAKGRVPPLSMLSEAPFASAARSARPLPSRAFSSA